MKKNIFIWLALFVFISSAYAQSEDDKTKGLKKITPDREYSSHYRASWPTIDLSGLESLADINIDFAEIDFDMDGFELDMEAFADEMADISIELSEIDFDFSDFEMEMHDFEFDMKNFQIDMEEMSKEIHESIKGYTDHFHGRLCDNDEHVHKGLKPTGQKRVRE
jgi:hypothetical protein